MKTMFIVILCAVSGAFAQPTPTMMKAIVVHEYGSPEVARFEDAPVPAPKENEALVKVIAAGVNPADALAVSGKHAKEWGTQLPLVPGYDIAGTVVKIGAAVTKLKPGDAVYGYPLMGGGWAQYCAVAETDAALTPKSATFTEAAAVPLAALTAWQALVDTIGLKSGQTILIQGGSGGVGSLAVQLAKLRGARVLATASTANQEMLKQLGVDVAIDYTKQKFEEIARDVDAVLDTVGGETFIRSCKVVKKGGIVCTLVGAERPAGIEHLDIRVVGLWVKPNAEQLSEIAKLIDEKKLKPMVTEELPLSEGVRALKQAETHHTRGKMVLKVAGEPKG
jgi:NADPH:quinone reductase-like Zn-dependent oxidoreductase